MFDGVFWVVCMYLSRGTNWLPVVFWLDDLPSYQNVFRVCFLFAPRERRGRQRSSRGKISCSARPRNRSDFIFWFFNVFSSKLGPARFCRGAWPYLPFVYGILLPLE